jgi:catechol 2,3-dioxygenase-like lactoylglutathione lyase family enzyme
VLAFDHIGLVVADLDRSAAIMERLGFTLTARAAHRSEAAGAAVSEQRSVMLGRGYIELQTIADLNGGHVVAPAARRFFGAHILAFDIADARAEHARLQPSGIPLTEPMLWARRMDEPDTNAEARFLFFVNRYDPARDEAVYCWTQHLTPEAIRTPRLLRHDNGAQGIRRIVIAAETDDVARGLRQKYALLCGPEADGAFDMVGVRLEIRTRAQLPAAIAQAKWPASAWMAALEIDPSAGLNSKAASLGMDTAGGVLDLMTPLGVFILL